MYSYLAGFIPTFFATEIMILKCLRGFLSLALVDKHQILDLNGLGLLHRHTSQSSGEVKIAFREQTLDKCAPEYIITCILYHKLVAILFTTQSLMGNITAYPFNSNTNSVILHSGSTGPT